MAERRMIGRPEAPCDDFPANVISCCHESQWPIWRLFSTCASFVSPPTGKWNYRAPPTFVREQEVAMRVFLGMILGALLLVAGVYIYDSTQTSTATGGEVAQANRPIVNWDVAATDWRALKMRAHEDWIKLSSK
jgi:hypothetical protein